MAGGPSLHALNRDIKMARGSTVTRADTPGKVLPVATYTPASQVRSPAGLFVAMFRDLVASRDLAWRLTVRDISAQYRQSMLGLLWAFIPPLLSALLFIVLQQKRVVNIPDPGMPYALFVLVGTALWQTFADAVNAPLKVVTQAKPVLAKVNFPREALVLSALYQTLFGFLFKAILIVAVLVHFGVPLRWQSLLALGPVFLLVWLGTAIGLIVTPLGMLITDISLIVTFALQLAFFLTPVVYPPPQSFPYSLLATLNPVSPYLLASREMLARGTISNPAQVLAVTGLLVAGTFAGWVVYRVSMPIIIERISA
jgi:lipopolysaccharide transport system permease protein